MLIMGSLSEYFDRLKKGPAFKPYEEMQYEVLRTSSYVNWPNWAHKRPGDLAENGFYYSGEADRVICFSCKEEISNWTSMDKVTDRHRSMSENCEFIKGLDGKNVPYARGESNLSCDAGSRENSVENGEFEGGAACEIPKPNNEVSIDYNKSKPSKASDHGNHSTGSVLEVDELLEQISSIGPVTSLRSIDEPDQPMSNHVASPQVPEPGTGRIEEVDPTFVKYESYRLRTFAENWPADSFVSPAELAKAGFHFVNKPDRVQCAFCKGRLLNWKPTDVPMSEHRTHFPDCPFVMGRNVGNVKIEQSENSVQIPLEQREDKKKNQTPSERLGIMMDKPKHAEYAIEASRLETFKTWPKRRTIKQEELAKAGFFYVGYSDNVKCFFCDGGLRNWDVGDEPWREHARWFSRCGFLKLRMGEEYINQVLSETTNQGSGQKTKISEIVSAPQGQGPVSAPRQLDIRELKARMDTPMIRTVIDMGFEADLVKKVLEARLRMTGDDFVNAEQLLQAVFEEQEVRQQEQKVPIDKGSEPAVAENTKSGMSRRKKRNRKKKKKNESGDKPEDARNLSSPSPEDTIGRGAEGAAEPESDSDGSEELNDVQNVGVEDDEEIQALSRQYQRIKEERTCKICMDEECTIVFLPCGHLVCCASCAPALRNCPICRTLIKGSVRIFTT